MTNSRSLWYYQKKAMQQYGADLAKEMIDNKKAEIEKSQFVIPRIEVVVTVRCNLRCMGCSHLMDRYANVYDVDIDEILYHLEQLLACIDECICIGITGGEPFLYPHLSTLFEYLCKNKKISFVEINTNGTVVPQSVSYLRDPKASVYISRYSGVEKTDKLIEEFQNEQVFYYYEDETQWIDYGNFENRNYRKSQQMQNYMECMDSFLCKTLLKGRLYCCPREAFASDLGIFAPDDYVDLNHITDPDILIPKLQAFFDRKYSKICNHCSFSTSNTMFIKSGIQQK